MRLSGEVFFPGDYSLERQDEKLSSIIARAGGLKPSAYPVGARVIRQEDQIGNIAVDLIRALEEPGSTYDIIMMDRDQIIVPEWQYTVKVTGEVGFPTSLVWEQGKSIDYYVERAGGYLENADQKMTMPKKVKLGKAVKKIQSDMDKQMNTVLTEDQQKAYAAYKEAQKG